MARSASNNQAMGEKIKYYRQKQNMTQKELGEACGIDAANIRKYESGRQNPKIETLEKIAIALDVGVGELYGDYELLHRIGDRAATKKFEFQLSKMEGYLGQLNEEGRNIALERVRELAEIPRYQDADGRKAAQEQNKNAIESMQRIETPSDIQKLIQEFSRRGELPEGYTGTEPAQKPTESPQDAAGDSPKDTDPKKY